MLHTNKITYADVPKTGSTAVTRAIVSIEPAVAQSKHQYLERYSVCEFAPVLKVLSIRDPFSWYLSYFNYFRAKKGGIHNHWIRGGQNPSRLAKMVKRIQYRNLVRELKKIQTMDNVELAFKKFIELLICEPETLYFWGYDRNFPRVGVGPMSYVVARTICSEKEIKSASQEVNFDMFLASRIRKYEVIRNEQLRQDFFRVFKPFLEGNTKRENDAIEIFKSKINSNPLNNSDFYSIPSDVSEIIRSFDRFIYKMYF